MKDENVSLLSRFSGLFAKKPIAPIEAVKGSYHADPTKMVKSPTIAVSSNMVIVLDKNEKEKYTADKYKTPSSPAKAHAKAVPATIGESNSTSSSRWLSMLRFGGSTESVSSVSQSGAKTDYRITSKPPGSTRPDGKPENYYASKKPAATPSKETRRTEDDTANIKQLGLYDVGTTIGSGTFSKVRMGYNRVTGEKVAVKIITKNENQKGFNTKRIFQEVNVQKAAIHPRICQILNVFDTGSHVCIILEYAPTDLLQYINSTRLKYLSEIESRNLFTQIMDGVNYLHKRGIIHRDLKPQNVLLDMDLNVKIADFGFGKIQNEDLLSTVCGSSVYAAPELVRYKKAYAGKPADIWACGVILYNMLLGKMPFKKLSQQLKTTARHILYDPLIPEPELMLGLELPALLSADATDLLRRLVSIDVGKRLTATEVLTHQWMQGPVVPTVSRREPTVLSETGSFPV